MSIHHVHWTTEGDQDEGVLKRCIGEGHLCSLTLSWQQGSGLEPRNGPIPKSVGYVGPVEDPKMFFSPNSKLILNLCLENNNKNFRKGEKERTP